MKRGDIYLANLDPVIGSEISKTRPVLIISNDINNTFSSTITVLPITSALDKIYPFQVFLSKEESKLNKESKIKADQIRTIDKKRLSKKLSQISNEKISEIEKALLVHLGINL